MTGFLCGTSESENDKDKKKKSSRKNISSNENVLVVSINFVTIKTTIANKFSNYYLTQGFSVRSFIVSCSVFSSPKMLQKSTTFSNEYKLFRNLIANISIVRVAVCLCVLSLNENETQVTRLAPTHFLNEQQTQTNAPKNQNEKFFILFFKKVNEQRRIACRW